MIESSVARRARRGLVLWRDQGAEIRPMPAGGLSVPSCSEPGRSYRVSQGGKKPLVAQWGGITLARSKGAVVLNDEPKSAWNTNRTELLQRLLADQCELCGSQKAVQVHHVRSLKDLKRKGRAEKPGWVKQMASRQRKTLVVCRKCHTDTHAGRHSKGRPKEADPRHRRAG